MRALEVVELSARPRTWLGLSSVKIPNYVWRCSYFLFPAIWVYLLGVYAFWKWWPPAFVARLIRIFVLTQHRWQSSVGNYSVTGVTRTSDASIGGGRILGKTKNMASPFFGKNSELCLAMLLFLVSRNLNLSARSKCILKVMATCFCCSIDSNFVF